MLLSTFWLISELVLQLLRTVTVVQLSSQLDIVAGSLYSNADSPCCWTVSVGLLGGRLAWFNIHKAEMVKKREEEMELCCLNCCEM